MAAAEEHPAEVPPADRSSPLAALPVELVYEIALSDPAVYRALVRALPWFGRDSRDAINQRIAKQYLTRPDARGNWRLPDGTRHRVGGPAVMWRRADGTKAWEAWYDNGDKHRAGGPAEAWWHADGTKEWEEWWENGQQHRVGGPAETWRRADGTKEWEEWWENGVPVLRQVRDVR